MAYAHLPISFWGDALLTAAYILNPVISKSVPATLYELWHGRKPFLDHLCLWGSAGYVHNPTHRHGKLGPRATKMVFIWYPDQSKGYAMYGEHPNGGMTEVDSRNVDFLEDEFPSISEIKNDLASYELPLDDQLSLGEEDFSTHRTTEDSRQDVPLSVNQEGQPDTEVRPQIQLDNEVRPHSPINEHEVSPAVQHNRSDSPPVKDSIPLRDRGRNSSVGQTSTGAQLQRSEGGRIPRRYFQIEEEIFLCTPLEIEEPTSFQEAIDSPNHKEWMEAMRDEMDSMARNKVWELIDFPPRRKSIENKCVFKIKRRPDRTIDKFKAHLVAKGFTQIEGIDYEETFSAVVRIASVRLVLALLAHLDLELFQMDVKTTFLNGNLEEEIYIDQPIGLYQKVKRTMFIVLKDQSMVSNSLPERGISDSMKPLFLLA